MHRCRIAQGALFCCIMIACACASETSPSSFASSSRLHPATPDALASHQSAQTPACSHGATDKVQPIRVRQKVYVPIYTQIRKNEQFWTVSLTVTLSVRNTDLNHPIILNSVCEYDSNGLLRKNYISAPLEVGALASEHFTVEETKHQGETGASFVIDWQSRKPVNQPIIEAVIINRDTQNNMAFISPGRVIEDHTTPQNSEEESEMP